MHPGLSAPTCDATDECLKMIDFLQVHINNF